MNSYRQYFLNNMPGKSNMTTVLTDFYHLQKVGFEMRLPCLLIYRVATWKVNFMKH